MGMLIGITSAKGGIGKSTMTVNLACALAHEGKKVVAVDLCMRTGALSVLFGMENRGAYSLLDVLEGNVKLIPSLIRVDEFGGLFLLQSSAYQEFPPELSERLLKLLNAFKREFDYVVVDYRMEESSVASVISLAADRVLYVCGCDSLSVRNTKKAAQLLNEETKAKTYTLLNRVQVGLVKSAEMQALEYSVNEIGLSLVGVLPEDRELLLQTETHKPIYSNHSLAADIFIRIAKRLQGTRIPVSLRDDRSE